MAIETVPQGAARASEARHNDEATSQPLAATPGRRSQAQQRAMQTISILSWIEQAREVLDGVRFVERHYPAVEEAFRSCDVRCAMASWGLDEMDAVLGLLESLRDDVDTLAQATEVSHG